MDTERVKLYFERIGLAIPDTIVPDGALLKKLVFHQLLSIPYENTQFLTGEIVPCEPDALFKNIVIEKKGGICHDIAGLFGWFLSELGYKVRQMGTLSFLEKIGRHVHKTLIVTDCEGKEWLAEIGYGAFSNLNEPLPFTPNVDLVCGKETFRFEERDGMTCLIGPTEAASFKMAFPDISNQISTKIKESTIAGEDPQWVPKRNFTIGTPEGRRILSGNTYKEYFGDTVYVYTVTKDTLPWAYAQFGLTCEE